MTALESLSPTQRALLERRLARARVGTSTAESIPRLPDGVAPPMSFAQQRLWFLHQYDPEDPSYNIPVSFRLYGDVDLDALSAALADLVAAHDVLHTRYPAENGEPVPTRSPDQRPQFRLVDVPAEDDLDVTVDADVRRPFDLAADLPIRATVYRRSAQEHMFVLELHHIAADGWSLSLLLGELGKRYDGQQHSSPAGVAEPVLRYGDVAAWQAQRLSGPLLARELQWWKETLGDAPHALALPADRPRPPIATTRGARFDHVFPAELADRVRAGAGQDGCTPFMVCLAGLGIALSRICGADDLVVGVPVAGRLTPELERVVGCFVNTLAMRLDASGDPTGAELLARVRARTLDAYDHQEVPFEKLVEHLAPQRDLSTSAVFQVMLNVHNQPLLDLRLAGVRTEWVDIGTATTKFDLNLAVVDSDGTMTVTFTYNTDLFEPATVQRLARAFQLALAGLCADPAQRVSGIRLLADDERVQLTSGRNDTAAGYPRGETVHELIEQQAARVPGAIAVSSGGQDCTYADLNARANRLAGHLAERGVGPESVVAVFLEPSVDWVVAVLGTLKAGAAYLPVDARYPAGRVAAMLADSGAAVVLTSSRLGYDGAVPSLALDTLTLDGATLDGATLDGATLDGATLDGADPSAGPAGNPGVALPANALMYLLFTSGSTGRPKAVAVQHDNVVNYLYGVRERAGLEPGLSYAQVSTLAADLGNTNVFGALTSGGRLHLLSYEQATDPDVLADYFARHHIDVMKLVPSHFDVLLGAANPRDVVPHRTLILAGEACRPELVRRALQLRPDTGVHNHYGPTETTVSMLGCDAGAELGSATIPLGRPFGNVRCYVLDAALEPMPDGMPGELYIGGAGVARGYHDRPRLTAERFVPDPFATEPGSRLYRTGDRVRWRPDGMLEFLARVDAQLKIRGYRVEPGEVESVLADQPEVAQAAVRAWGEAPDVRLAAYLVLRTGQPPEAVTAVHDRLRSALPDYLVPSAIVALDALPLTGNGKLDRAALPEPTADSATGEYAEPRTELEAELAGIFADVLAVERVGIDDNFFDLGGESFKAVRVVRRISQPVRVVEIFTRPTVRELAASLQEPDAADRLLHRLTPASTRPDVSGNESGNVSMVCVPYGGGSAVTYQPLADALAADIGHGNMPGGAGPGAIALWALQLPGHDPSRPEEAPAPLREVARRCAEEVLERIPGEVIVYGHCLGGALAVELARLIEASGRTVRGVVLAGTFPAARLPGRLFSLLHRVFPADRWTSTRAYREFLQSLGGVDDTAPEAEQELLIAALRHDLREAEEYYTWAWEHTEPGGLAAPILCIVGGKDRATELYDERFREWEHFSDRVTLAVLPRAGHYFLKHQAAALAGTLRHVFGGWRGDGAVPGLPDGVATRAAEPGPAVASTRPSLRAFGVLAGGQFVSLVGTSLSAFALGVYVFQQTGRVSAFALTLLTATAPAILAAPVAGAVADRFNRRLVMMVADTGAFLAMAVLALLYFTDQLQLWQVYSVSAAGSLANAFQRPAYFAAIAQLVPKRYLGHVNGVAQLGLGAGELIAPLIGGALVVLIGLGGILAIDAASFVVGITAMLSIRIPDLAFHKRDEALGREIVAGWHYILRRPGLVAMVVFFVVYNFLFSLPQALITPLVLSTAGPATLGLVAASAGVGILAGNIMMSLWGGTERRATGMVGGTVLTGAASAVAGLGQSPWLLAVGMFGLFCSLMIINAHWLALIQTKVGLELQGRVLATNQMLATSTLPLGFLVAGPLVSLASRGAVDQATAIQFVLLATGALLAIWGVAGLRYRPLRLLEDDLPDAVPEAEVGSRDEEQAAADRLLALSR